MKRLISISLLAIFFFNVGGYYLVFWGLHTQASLEMISKLDSGSYSHDETIVIKIPITLPYPLQDNGYERINGSFEYRHQYYKLVEQKIEADTLYMVCIKDKNEEKLQHALTDYTKVSNDLPNGLSKEASGIIGKLLKEYNSQIITVVQVHLAGWCKLNCYASLIPHWKSMGHPILSPPPWC